MSRMTTWVKASRVASQTYIAPPLLFGQAYHFFATGELSWAILIWVQLFGIFDQLYIVYANDYADAETDRHNRTPTLFSGGSRVLVDGDLRRPDLARAAALMAVAAVGVALALAALHGRWWAVPMVVVALALLWMYSFPPFSLSYRGGGEILQMSGVGLLLPLFGYYAQAGTFAGFPWPMMWVLLPTNLACAIATSLPDEPSDRLSRKRTLTVWLGPRAARWAVVVLNAVSIVALVLVSWLHPSDASLWLLVFLPALATVGQLALRSAEPGTGSLLARVALAILATVSLTTSMSVALLLS